MTRWYREHGYQFLVLSDHNVLTSIEALSALHGKDDEFLLIKGEEVTDAFGGRPVHINGLDVGAKVDPQRGTSLLDVLQRNVDEIRRVRGVPHINHPNFRWAFSTEELRQVRNMRLLEIFNGHPQVNNLGGGGVPGLEEVWDAILSSGTLMYGIAVDDAHTFKQPGNPAVAGPGRGWVMVRAERLEARAILQALEDGRFYASTGVELSDYVATARGDDRHREEGRVGEVPDSVHRPRAAACCTKRSTARPTTCSRAMRGTCGPRSSRATAAWRGASRCWSVH